MKKLKLMSECGMWAAVPIAVMTDVTLPVGPRLMYAIIVSHCRPRRGIMQCFAGLATLARECGVSQATTKRWLLELTTAGVIARQRRRNTSTMTFLADITQRYGLANEAEERTGEPVNEERTGEPLSRCT